MTEQERAQAIEAQVDIMFRMLAGALGQALPDDPAWFKAKVAALKCDFGNDRAVRELAELMQTECRELCLLTGVDEDVQGE